MALPSHSVQHRHGLPPVPGPYARVAASSDFDPTDVANLVAWWDASTLGLSDAAAVSSWADSSGNGYTLTQGTGANQPIYKTGIRNGKGVVRFQDVTDHLEATMTMAGTTRTIFLVTKNTSAATGYYYDMRNGGTNRCYRFDTAAVPRMSNGTNLNSVTALDTNWHYETHLFNGASSVYRRDGVSDTTGNAGASAWDGIRVGCVNSSAATGMAKDIAELIVYSGVLSAGSYGLVEAYLRSKWGF